MNLLYLLGFGISGVLLLLIFLRRMRLTSQDIKFQKHLEEEEALREEPLPELEEERVQVEGSRKKALADGEALFKKKAWSDAEPFFLAVVDMDPTHMDAHEKLGLIYMNLEDFANAELYFNKLVNMKKDPVFFSNLGAALYQQQRLIEAAEAYENAIALCDKRANRLQSLAQVYYELDNHEKAHHYFERASKKKPKDKALKSILKELAQHLENLQ